MVDDTNFLDQTQDQIVNTMLAEDTLTGVRGVASDPASELFDPTVGPTTGRALSPESATSRASRYAYGTQDYKDSDPTKFYADLLGGKDDELRAKYAKIQDAAVGAKKYEDTQRILSTKLSTTGLTDEDMARIKENEYVTPSDPTTIFEANFAGQLIKKATTSPRADSPHSAQEALDENPSVAEQAFNHAQDLITAQQYAAKKYEEVEDLIKEQNTANWVSDIVEGFIPFASQYRLQNAFKQSDAPWLKGNNLEDSYTLYYTASPEERVRMLDEAIDSMGSNSLQDARAFLQGLMSYSASDKAWDNVASTSIDVASITPLGLVFKGAKSGTKALVNNLKTTTAAVQTTKTTANQALSAIGETAEAGYKLALEKAAKAEGSSPSLNTMASIDGDAVRIFQPETVVGGPSASLSRPIAKQISELISLKTTKFLDEVLDRPLRIDRLTGQSLDVAVEEARRVAKMQYREQGDHVVDISLADKSKNLTNNDFVEITFGKTGGELFDTAEEAGNFATQRLGLTEGSIRQVGDNKFAVIVAKPIDETSVSVRNALEIQTKNATPASRTNMFLGWARGRDYTVSKELAGDLKVAAYGSSQLARVAKEMYKEVGDLGSKDYKDFVKFLEHQRDKTDPITGLRGTYSRTVGEFERDWTKRVGTPPSEKTTKAYMAHTTLNDVDWTLRNMSVYTFKTRKGIEEFEVKYGATAAARLEGKFLPDLPWDIKEDAGLFILDDATATSAEKVYLRKNYMSSGARENLKELISRGQAKVIQLTPDGEDALKKLPGLEDVIPKGGIDYVIVSAFKSKPLGLKQIPYRPGGHVEHVTGTQFIRQPIIVEGKTQRSYHGDRTMLAFDTEAQAKKFLPLYEEARKILAAVVAKSRPEKDLADYLAKHLPDSVKDFKATFNPKDGGFDVNTPLVIAPKGKSVDDIVHLANTFKDGKEFINRPRSVHSLIGPEDAVRYTGERSGNLLSIVERGSDLKPELGFKKATLVDPVSNMDHAAQQLMRGKYLEDVKLKYSEHFLSEFGDTLEPSFKDAIRDPYHALLDAKFKSDFADRPRLSAAQNYRRSMLEFLSLKSKATEDFDWMRQKLADKIYEKGGQAKLDLYAPHLLHREKDPVAFFKQFAFHTKLGLFNPKQLFLQAQSVTHVAAVEGVPRALNAMGAGYIQMAMRFTDKPDIIQAAAKRAEKLGWDPKQFLESYEGLKRSGFANVGREVAVQEGLLQPRLRNSKAGAFLDSGTWFFNTGEQVSRVTAWNAAYLRWAAANPGKKFNDKAMKEVLSRADLLSVNMSNASNASWQYGWTSIPTQFMGYRARLMEQFLGKQLTTGEKAHAFGVYGAVYGIPVGTTIPFALWPVNEEIKEYAQLNGYNLDDNMITKAAKDGIGSLMIQAITGEDTNFETLYGPGPITQFRDLLEGDKTIAEIMGGISGTVFADMYVNAQPMLRSLWDTMADHETSSFKTTTKDIVDFAASISTVSQAQKAWYAINYGKYYAKNQGDLVEVESNVVAGVLTGLFGLTPQSVEDMYTTVRNLNDLKDVQKREQKEAIKYYRLGWRAQNESRVDEAMEMFRRAKMHQDWGGFDAKLRAETVAEAARNNIDAVDSLDWALAQKNKVLMDAYIAKKGNK